MKFFGFVLVLFLLSGPALFADDSPAPGHIGIGVNYKGAQVDWRPSPRWMFEVRYQHDTAADPVPTKSSVVGFRGYRLFRPEKSLFFLSGLEAAVVEAKQDDTSYDAHGVAGGAFVGIGRKLGTHFLLMLDAGPYWVQLKEQNSANDSSELHFIGDAALLFTFW